MGYYLPFHDNGAVQYANRIHKLKYPEHLVPAPLKISESQKVKRDNPLFNGASAKSGVSRKPANQKWISQAIYVNQNLYFNIEGKGKYINESI